MGKCSKCKKEGVVQINGKWYCEGHIGTAPGVIGVWDIPKS